MHSHRTFVAGAVALAAIPATAAKPTPPPRTANIRWPGPGHELHGYMAIPARAHGAQPSVMVVPDAASADAFTRGFVDRLALAGFVACAPSRLASLDEGLATVRWLATNAYATGRVAAVGLGWGSALVDRIAASSQPLLAGAVTFDASENAMASVPAPVLRLDAIGHMDSEVYTRAWLRMIAFLKEHLG